MTFDLHYTVTMGTPVWRTMVCDVRSSRLGPVWPILIIEKLYQLAVRSTGLSTALHEGEEWQCIDIGLYFAEFPLMATLASPTA